MRGPGTTTAAVSKTSFQEEQVQTEYLRRSSPPTAAGSYSGPGRRGLIANSLRCPIRSVRQDPGRSPRRGAWRRSGRVLGISFFPGELFGGFALIQAIPIQTDPTLVRGNPVEAFELPDVNGALLSINGIPQYDVTPDGARLLMSIPARRVTADRSRRRLPPRPRDLQLVRRTEGTAAGAMRGTHSFVGAVYDHPCPK